MLILVRHGRTSANAARLLQGRLDLPLDEVGREQAQAIARALTGIDRLVVSPLQRARETAGALGVEAEIDERWIEIDYGVLDGTPVADVPDEVWHQWWRDPDFAPEGGESHTALYERVVAALEEMVEAARTSNIVVVSHMSPIKAAIGWALGLPSTVAWRGFLDQASISRIAVDVRGPVLSSFNETGHLS